MTVDLQKAIENDDLQLIYPFKLMIFPRVRLPEGIQNEACSHVENSHGIVWVTPGSP